MILEKNLQVSLHEGGTGIEWPKYLAMLDVVHEVVLDLVTGEQDYTTSDQMDSTHE
jgi:hypothetical protein